jgi:hypothetical protein
MTNEQLIADAKEAGAKPLNAHVIDGKYFDYTIAFTKDQLITFADIIRKRHEHIRTDNGAVIAKLQSDLDKAKAEHEDTLIQACIEFNKRIKAKDAEIASLTAWRLEAQDLIVKNTLEIARLRDAITKWSAAKKQANNNPRLLLSNEISHQEAIEVMNVLFTLEAELEVLAQGEQNGI